MLTFFVQPVSRTLTLFIHLVQPASRTLVLVQPASRTLVLIHLVQLMSRMLVLVHLIQPASRMLVLIQPASRTLVLIQPIQPTSRTLVLVQPVQPASRTLLLVQPTSRMLVLVQDLSGKLLSPILDNFSFHPCYLWINLLCDKTLHASYTCIANHPVFDRALPEPSAALAASPAIISIFI